MYKILLILLFNFISFYVFAQERLTDLISNPNDGNSTPDAFVEFNGMLFFTATTFSEGLEFWKTDGTVEGTKLLKDIYPGSTGSVSRDKPVILNNSLYFLANNGSGATQLWKSDGTQAGTVKVTDFLSGGITRLTVVGNHLFFLINTFQYNWELWKSDGTQAGTLPVKKNITAWNNPDGLVAAGGLFYVALQPPGGNSVNLWRSDGTDAGTFSVIGNIDGNGAGGIGGQGGTSFLTQYIAFNNELYFVARSGSIFGWSSSVGIMKTNGSISGTVPVQAVRNGEILEYTDVLEWQGKLYFSFFDADANSYLIWETDGSQTGSRMVYNAIGNSYFIPSNLSATDTALMFAAPGINGGSYLTLLNPANGQTQELRKISDSSQKPFLFNKTYDVSFIYKGGGLFSIHAVPGNSSGYSTLKDIYFSDGTPLGTILLEKPKILSISNKMALYYKSNFFFPGYEQKTGIELWRSDGTLTETYLLKNINSASSGALSNSKLHSLNGKLLFNANDTITGDELWHSDGTKLGTVLLRDIFQGKKSSYPFYYGVSQTSANLGNDLIFSAYELEHGEELWKTDGTAEGTFLLKDLLVGAASAAPRFFTTWKSTLFFITNTENGHYNLWKTDGSVEGTMLVKDFGKNLSNVSYEVKKIIATDERIFIELQGGGLWKSDGTEAGTVKIKDFYDIHDVISVNNIAYFTLLPSYQGQYELWKSDGSPEGTMLVKTLSGDELSPPVLVTTVNNKILFTVRNPISGRELWISDGTADGTSLLKDIAPGSRSGISASPAFVKKDNLVYFQADDTEHGAELWQTDGTSAATRLVKDILPGIQGSYPNNLTLIDNMLYFAAFVPEYGMELWKSDGSEVSTLLAADVIPGPTHSNPIKMLGLGNNIFFIADSERNGQQLWNLSQKQNQQITFSSIPVKTYKDAAFELEAVASSGLPVIFSVSSGPATLSEKTLTITGAGQITIKASQAGNDIYYETSAEQTFIVNKASQTITFSSLANRTINETPVELVATSSSGLAVSFTVISGQASIENNILTVHGPGQITLQALQNGNENYSPADPIERILIVSPVLGIEDELSAKVKLFPNPASNFLYLQVPKEMQKASLQIIDLKGRIMAGFQLNGQESIQILVGQLPKGIYIIQIYNSQHSFRRKFNIN